MVSSQSPTGFSGSPAWFRDPNKVSTRIAGVFEGGGAKGIAYVGALRALLDQHCWFEAVAGTSAGAITAAFIAAGLEPKEIERSSKEVFDQISVGLIQGLRGLRREAGFFDGIGLRDWLDNTFRAQLAKYGHAKTGDDPVEFGELFETTKIELNVVAANLSRGMPIVFNSFDTPKCQVADAVVASSSIPFAFSSSLLEARPPGPGHTRHLQTIVDGGVWANFPMFVFNDSTFRKLAGETPKPDYKTVVGFLLHEQETNIRAEQERAEMLESRFARTPIKDFRAWEWRPRPAAPAAPGTSLYLGGMGGRKRRRLLPRWLGIPLLCVVFPMSVFASTVRKLSQHRSPGRWPQPQNLLLRHLVGIVDGTLAAIHSPLAAFYVWGFVAFSSIFLGIQVWKGSGLFELTADRAGFFLGGFALIFHAIMAMSISLVIFVGLLLLLLSLYLFVGARRLLYGLVRAYVTGAGASYWTHLRDDVIALPITKGIDALHFDITDTEADKLICMAYKATKDKLEKTILRRMPVSDPSPGTSAR